MICMIADRGHALQALPCSPRESELHLKDRQNCKECMNEMEDLRARHAR